MKVGDLVRSWFSDWAVGVVITFPSDETVYVEWSHGTCGTYYLNASVFKVFYAGDFRAVGVITTVYPDMCGVHWSDGDHTYTYKYNLEVFNANR